MEDDLSGEGIMDKQFTYSRYLLNVKSFERRLWTGQLIGEGKDDAAETCFVIWDSG